MATNATFLIGDSLLPYSIKCNATGLAPNQTIIWVQTLNKVKLYAVQTDNRITIADDGQTLNFAQLALIDEEYYGCGAISQNKFKLLNTYYLYVRGKKISYLIN